MPTGNFIQRDVDGGRSVRSLDVGSETMDQPTFYDYGRQALDPGPWTRDKCHHLEADLLPPQNPIPWPFGRTTSTPLGMSNLKKLSGVLRLTRTPLNSMRVLLSLGS